jgi:hypothetical protein
MHSESQSELELSLKALETMQFGPKWGPSTQKRDAFPREHPRPSFRKAPAFEGRSHAKPYRERLPSAPPPPRVQFLVDFYPEEAPFKALSKAIRHSHKTYELFELARLVLEKPERFSISVKKLNSPKATGLSEREEDLNPSDFTPFTVYHSVLDGLCFESQSDALSHVLKHHGSVFFNIEEREVEAPKGHFPFIQCCGITGEPIGPPNYHRYSELLQFHYKENIQGLSFEQFLKRIKSDKSPDMQSAWLEKMKKQKCYRPMDAVESEAEPLTSAEAAKHYLLMHCKGKAIKEASSLKIPGVSLEKLSGTLKASIEEALFHERGFPLELANHIRSRLRHYGFFIYKKGSKGITYVSAIKRKRRDASTQFSASIQKLISFLDEHPLLSLAELLEQFLGLPAGTDFQEATALNPLLKSTMTDLEWLVTEGYVVHYSDGRLEALRPLDTPEHPENSSVAAKALGNAR